MRPDVPANDDLAIFDEAPQRAFELRPRGIRPHSRRGPLIASAWVVGLALIVGVGVLPAGSGQAPSTSGADAGRQADATAPDLAIDVLGGYPPAGYPGARRRQPLSFVMDVVALDAPAPAWVESTTPAVEVLGSVLVRASRIEVALEASGNRVLEQVSIDVSDPHGGIRPERAPTFSASFDLPFPRPNGTMWIVVTAYDPAGFFIGGTRQPFAVGPLLEPDTAAGAAAAGAAADTAANTAARTVSPGIAATEDVPLLDPQSPVIGAPPTCLPRSPTHSSTC